MPEPKGDHADVDASLQQMHRRGVPNGMWRNVTICQVRDGRGRGRHRQSESLGNIDACHRMPIAVWQQDRVGIELRIQFQAKLELP